MGFSNQYPILCDTTQRHSISDIQLSIFSPPIYFGEKALTGSSHNLTGVKSIFSVRAFRSTYLCLNLMILTLIKILFECVLHSTTHPLVRCGCFLPLQYITFSPLCLPSFIPICADALRQNGD